MQVPKLARDMTELQVVESANTGLLDNAMRVVVSVVTTIFFIKFNLVL